LEEVILAVRVRLTRAVGLGVPAGEGVAIGRAEGLQARGSGTLFVSADIEPRPPFASKATV